MFSKTIPYEQNRMQISIQLAVTLVKFKSGVVLKNSTTKTPFKNQNTTTAPENSPQKTTQSTQYTPLRVQNVSIYWIPSYKIPLLQYVF